MSKVSTLISTRGLQGSSTRRLEHFLIEDDCASVGGEKEWCITNLREDIKKRIKFIIVKEFKGINSTENNIT